jgi:AcrR family transcriptional regulator
MYKKLKLQDPTRRRTLGLRGGGRSRRVVDTILRATVEKLGETGYVGLRVEEVAAQSGVNKTTIYRRWPKKSDLVLAALRHLWRSEAPPDTGTLRGDLLELMRRTIEFCQTPLGAGVFRVLQAERAHLELEGVLGSLRAEKQAERFALIQRGIARGELPRDTDAELVVETIFGTLFGRLHRGEALDVAFAARVIDLVLAGAGATTA